MTWTCIWNDRGKICIHINEWGNYWESANVVKCKEMGGFPPPMTLNVLLDFVVSPPAVAEV